MIKILFLGSSPADQAKLRLDREVRAIQEQLQAVEFREQFQFEQRWAVRPQDLTGYLLQVKPNIVHFSGHNDEEEGLIFEDENGNSQAASPEAMQALFSLSYVKKAVSCVIFNACVSLPQAKRVAQFIDCVIGTSNDTTDRSAASFATGFYQGLGYGLSIRDAFESARAHLQLGGMISVAVELLERTPEAGERILTQSPRQSLPRPGPKPAVDLGSLRQSLDRPLIRRALQLHMPDDGTFTAFVQDYFPLVGNRFSSGMDRTSKTNLLMLAVEPEELVAKLIEWQQLQSQSG